LISARSRAVKGGAAAMAGPASASAAKQPPKRIALFTSTE
jgi:hypothetical protein